MSKRNLTARPLDPRDLDRWEVMAGKHGCLFDSVRWTDVFGPAIRRIGIYDAGGRLRGGFCAQEQRRWGLRIWRQPPYTPYGGPFYESQASNPAARTDEQRDVMDAMAEYLDGLGAAGVFLGLPPDITDALPFFWRGWKVVPLYTYRIQLKQDADLLLAAMSSAQRSHIKKALQAGIEVDVAANPDELRQLIDKTYARQEKTWDTAAWQGVLAAFPPPKGSYCCIARQNGAALAGVLVVHDSRTAYNLVSGFDSGQGNAAAGALVRWQAILHAQRLGLDIFDFEGSVQPRIERFNRAFGGALTPCLTVQKAWLPLEMVLKCHPRYRNRF
jgi:hypothetical protein